MRAANNDVLGAANADTAHDDSDEVEELVEPNFNYPADSNVRQRIQLEAANAAGAAASSVEPAIPTRNRRRKKSNKALTEQDKYSEKVKHQDVGVIVEGAMKGIKKSAEMSTAFMPFLERSLKLQEQRITPSQTADSPHTKNRKSMDTIKSYEEMVNTLRKRKREMEADGEDARSIQARIKRYEDLVRNLEDEL